MLLPPAPSVWNQAVLLLVLFVLLGCLLHFRGVWQRGGAEVARVGNRGRRHRHSRVRGFDIAEGSPAIRTRAGSPGAVAGLGAVGEVDELILHRLELLLAGQLVRNRNVFEAFSPNLN